MFATWNDKQTGFAVFTVFLLLFGLGLKETLFFALAGGTFTILCISRWWYRHALKNITVKMSFVTKRMFPDDRTQLRIEITNAKGFSVPFLKLFFKTLSPIAIHDMDSKSISPRQNRYSVMCSIKPRQTLVFEYEATVEQRGYYRIEDVQIEAGDPFGLHKASRNIQIDSDIIVYPKLLPPLVTKTNFVGEQGKFTVRRFMFDDPTYNLGSRPYQPGDPMKRIDWNVSARTGAYHTKQFDYTSDKHVVILANIQTSEVQWMDQKDEVKERTISALATMVKWCSEKGYTFEWMMNIKLPRARQLVHETGGTNKKDGMLHLEKLGRLKAYVTVDIASSLVRMKELSPTGRILIVITSYLTSTMRLELERWIHYGGQVWVLDPSDDDVAITMYTGSRSKGGRNYVS